MKEAGDDLEFYKRRQRAGRNDSNEVVDGEI
jgi:hypothetical protein